MCINQERIDTSFNVSLHMHFHLDNESIIAIFFSSEIIHSNLIKEQKKNTFQSSDRIENISTFSYYTPSSIHFIRRFAHAFQIYRIYIHANTWKIGPNFRADDLEIATRRRRIAVL